MLKCMAEPWMGLVGGRRGVQEQPIMNFNVWKAMGVHKR